MPSIWTYHSANAPALHAWTARIYTGGKKGRPWPIYFDGPDEDTVRQRAEEFYQKSRETAARKHAPKVAKPAAPVPVEKPSTQNVESWEYLL